MKASQEIKGLRIISIADGTQMGAVKDLILNPKTGSLDFFIIDQPTDYFGAKVIPFNDIIGLGEFAVTIPDPQVIQDVSQNLAAQDLLKQDVMVIGTQVLTKKGSLIGEVVEYHVDEETGKISACSFVTPEGNSREVAAEDIITFGKELLIIDADYNEVNASMKRDALSGAEPVNAFVNPVSMSVQESFPQSPEGSEAEAAEVAEVAEFNLFEQRQLQYFLGKTVDKDIVLDNGDTLKAGEIMNDDIIRNITSRSKLMEITSYLHKN